MSRGRYITDIILLSILVLTSLFLNSVNFPTMEIFGRVHVLPTEGGHYITITTTTLGGVMRDSYYSTGLKTGYVFMLILNIGGLLLLAYALVYQIMKKGRASYGLVSGLMIPEILGAFLTADLKAKSHTIGPYDVVFTVLSLLVFFVYWIYNHQAEKKNG